MTPICLMGYHVCMAHVSYPDHQILHLGAKGRIVLPAEVRRSLGLEQGDRFLLKVREDGTLELVSVREVVRRSRGMFAHLAPGISLADALVEERHQEAEQE